MLDRALHQVEAGRYIEVGANDPTIHSITLAFYKRGWSGITVEPVAAWADKHREERPRDTLVQAAVSDGDADTVVLHQIDDTGLSTLVDNVGARHREDGWTVTDVVVPARRLDDILESEGWAGQDIHFMTVDTEGSERSVLQSIDLKRWRPWVIVVESTEPLTTRPSHESWEQILLSADYRFTLFDGLSRFYVAAEHADELGPSLSYPACVHDVFDTPHILDLRATITRLDGARIDLEARLAAEHDRVSAEFADERGRLTGELAQAREQERRAIESALLWRRKAIGAWAQATGPSRAEMEELIFLREHAHAMFTELTALRRTVSWRVTAPLRRVRTVTSRQAGR